MKGLLYTIVTEMRCVVDEQGNLPSSLHSWLQSQRRLTSERVEFVQEILNVAGFHCKLSYFYTSYLLDRNGDVCYGGSANNADESVVLLKRMLPNTIFAYIKSSEKNDDARLAVERYYKKFDLSPRYNPYNSIQPYATN